MKHTRKSLSLALLAAPLIAVLASCATTSTSSAPKAHRHGDIVHSHALTPGHGDKGTINDKTKRPYKNTTVKVAKKKIVVPVKAAKPSDIKPLGLKAIGHKHHTHVEPATGKESVPC